MDTPDRPPTYEEIKNHKVIDFGDVKWTACWYPQMGGYVAKAWASLSSSEQKETSCFEVCVYHDGEFPFDESTPGAPGNPAYLHHCSADQFIKFGNFLKTLAAACVGAGPFETVKTDNNQKETPEEKVKALHFVLGLGNTADPIDIIQEARRVLNRD